MLKIRILYEDDKALTDFLKKIHDNVSKVKISTEQKGRYKRAYIEIYNMAKKH